MRLTAEAERWPLASLFTISRGSKTEAEVITVTLQDGEHSGRGECVPYRRYAETVPQCLEALEANRGTIENASSQTTFALLPFAARNAVDCALWDLQAKRSGKPAWQLAGLPAPKPVTTAFTLSLDTAANMAGAARKAAHMPLLKLKLGTADDRERIAAIRKAVPHARLIIDANEGWTTSNLQEHLAACADHGIELVEQPLAASDDEALRNVTSKVTICADESAHGLESLPQLIGKYTAINIKLDKTGGLTPAIALFRAAKAADLKIMIGCMVATSLAMAPALLLATGADYVDLDGPLLLRQDRKPGLHIENGVMAPASPALWG